MRRDTRIPTVMVITVTTVIGTGTTTTTTGTTTAAGADMAMNGMSTANITTITNA